MYHLEINHGNFVGSEFVEYMEFETFKKLLLFLELHQEASNRINDYVIFYEE